ncbi:MAG: hypothetical protein ACRC35_11270 [Angustibacter sp.]
MKEINRWPHFANLSDDEEEVLIALAGAFDAGANATLVPPRGLMLGSPPTQLLVRFSRKRNRIVCAVGEAALDWDDLRTRASALLESAPAWTTFSMTGRFRHGGSLLTEHLQIRPVDDLRKWNRGPQHFAGKSQRPLNALLVDVEYNKPVLDGVAAIRLANWRREQAIREAAHLVSLATWLPVWQEPNREVWIHPHMGWAPEPPVNIHGRTAFHHPDLGDRDERPAAAESPPLELIPHDEFVTGRVDLVQTGHLYAADSLGDLHRALRQLDFLTRKRARRSLAYAHDATTATSSSLRTLAYAIAIEALCGQRGPGSTKRFEAFLDRYAGAVFGPEHLKDAYRLRSALAHGSHHHADVDDPDPGPTIDHLKARGEARAAILNWLRSPES